MRLKQKLIKKIHYISSKRTQLEHAFIMSSANDGQTLN